MAILGLLWQKGLNTDVVNLLLTQFHTKSAGGLRSSEVFFCNRSKFCSVLYLLEISPRFRLRIWFIRQITATKSWRPLGCQIHKALRSRNLGKNKCCAGMFDLQKKTKNVCKKTTFFSINYGTSHISKIIAPNSRFFYVKEVGGHC